MIEVFDFFGEITRVVYPENQGKTIEVLQDANWR